jgi:protein PhnA
MESKDANGNLLSDGDTIFLIKDLKVKGTSITIKRGTSIKNIRLTNNPAEIDCKFKKIKGLVLKTEFIKKN